MVLSEPHYTALDATSKAFRPDLKIVDDQVGINISVSIPWDIIDYVAELIRRLVRGVSELIEKRQKNTQKKAARQAFVAKQSEQMKARTRAVGRMAASRLRKGLEEGFSREEIMAGLSTDFNLPVVSIDIVIRQHNKELRARAERFRDIRLVRYASEGLSNNDIARLIGRSPSHTAKLVREAINKSQGKSQ